jgi:hypothetical protein
MKSLGKPRDVLIPALLYVLGSASVGHEGLAWRPVGALRKCFFGRIARRPGTVRGLADIDTRAFLLIAICAVAGT